MNKKLLKSFIIFALLGLSIGAKAQVELDPNTIPVGAPILSIAPDARAGGMGDAAAATAPDVYSQHWNSAKYAFHTRGAGVATSFTPWLSKAASDIYILNAVGFYKIGNEDNQAVSASLKYFKIGDIKTIFGDNQVSSFEPYEMAFDAGYSRKLSDKFSMGVVLRYTRLDYTSNNDHGLTSPSNIVSADIGAYYENYVKVGNSETLLSFGGNISNITGAKISFDKDQTSAFVPTNLRLGASWMYPVTEVSTFSFSLDMNKLLVPTPPTRKENESVEEFNNRRQDYLNQSAIGGIFKSFGGASFSEKLKELAWSFGAEYDYDSKFRIRAGYFYENKMKGNRQYFSFGAGYLWNMLQLDVAYLVSTVSNNPLDQTLRLSLAFDIPVKNRVYKSNKGSNL